MPFPVLPRPDQDPAEFLIQDPFGVRQSILPLLNINRQTGHLTGLGTAFCADPYGGFLTAQHIFDHVDLAQPPLDIEEMPAAMLSMGVVFGTVGIPQDIFAPVIGIHGFVDLTPDDPVISRLAGKTGPSIITDCLRLTLQIQSEARAKNVHPLPLRCSANPPAIGDRILAVGYPELGLVHDEPPPAHPHYVERMYGAIGEVTGVHLEGLGASRPWPIIELKANWRSGMSGGPLFNEAGEIVGLVSSSIEPDESGFGVGFGLWFGGFPLQRMMPYLDMSNPGNYTGFGVLRRSPWHLAGMFSDRAQAEACAASLGADYIVRFGSSRYGTDDFIYVS